MALAVRIPFLSPWCKIQAVQTVRIKLISEVAVPLLGTHCNFPFTGFLIFFCFIDYYYRHCIFKAEDNSDEQFGKLVDIGIPEAQLYKMAGNSVTTNVVTAVARKLLAEIEKLKKEEENA